jgi:hypothetical protein
MPYAQHGMDWNNLCKDRIRRHSLKAISPDVIIQVSSLRMTAAMRHGEQFKHQFVPVADPGSDEDASDVCADGGMP